MLSIYLLIIVPFACLFYLSIAPPASKGPEYQLIVKSFIKIMTLAVFVVVLAAIHDKGISIPLIDELSKLI